MSETRVGTVKGMLSEVGIPPKYNGLLAAISFLKLPNQPVYMTTLSTVN